MSPTISSDTERSRARRYIRRRSFGCLRLPNDGKRRIAKQLGGFLAALHHYEDKAITCQAGWIPKPGADPTGDLCVFAQFLDASECRELEANLRAMGELGEGVLFSAHGRRRMQVLGAD